MPTFTTDWFSIHIPSWKKILDDYKNVPVKILEIGCFEGRATLWLLKNLPQCTIWANDVFEQTSEYKEYGDYNHNYHDNFISNIEPYKDRVTVLRGYSFYVLQDLIKNNESFDIIYIDGSHKAVNVLQDMVLSWELLNDNGIMICDDYEWDRFVDNPKKAIDAFLDIYKDKYILLEKGSQVILKKGV